MGRSNSHAVVPRPLFQGLWAGARRAGGQPLPVDGMDRPHQCRGSAQVLSRTLSSKPMSTTGCAMRLPAINVSICSAARRPMASRGVLMLLRRGTMWAEAGRSLKPRTETCSGILIPQRSASNKAPWARSSLPKKIASTSGWLSSNCRNNSPPRPTDDGRGVSSSRSGSYRPAFCRARRKPSPRSRVRWSSCAPM